MQRIVSDDQRRPEPKSARPAGVASGSPPAASRRLPGGRLALAARHSCPAGFLTRSAWAGMVGKCSQKSGVAWGKSSR